MVLFLFSISAALFYSGSKYFPFATPKIFSAYRFLPNVLGGIASLLGILVLTQTMDITTAITIAAIALMTLIPTLVFSLVLYPKSWIGWAVILSIVAFIDLVRYAS